MWGTPLRCRKEQRDFVCPLPRRPSAQVAAWQRLAAVTDLATVQRGSRYNRGDGEVSGDRESAAVQPP